MTEAEYQAEMDRIASVYDVIDRALFAVRLAAQSCGGEHREIMMRAADLLEPLHDERHELENDLYAQLRADSPSSP